MTKRTSSTIFDFLHFHECRLPAQKSRGFTIVELLIVVVVIAILAAITIVSYVGINGRAKASALQETTKQAYTKLQTYSALNSDQYPTTLAGASLPAAPQGMTYQYYVNNASKPGKFCISTTSDAGSYFTTSMQSTPKTGTCNEQNLVSNVISDWVQGDYSQSNGNPSSSPTSRIRQPYLVAVEPGVTYAMNLNNTTYSFVIRTYDASQAFVASVGGVTSGTAYTVPAGVYYLGVGIYGSSSADYSTYTQMMADGTLVPSIVRQ